MTMQDTKTSTSPRNVYTGYDQRNPTEKRLRDDGHIAEPRSRELERIEGNLCIVTDENIREYLHSLHGGDEPGIKITAYLTPGSEAHNAFGPKFSGYVSFDSYDAKGALSSSIEPTREDITVSFSLADIKGVVWDRGSINPAFSYPDRPQAQVI